jgi:hypothetical protein
MIGFGIRIVRWRFCFYGGRASEFNDVTIANSAVCRLMLLTD